MELLNQPTLNSISITMDKDIENVMNALGEFKIAQSESMRISVRIKEESKKVVEFAEMFWDKLNQNCNDWILNVYFSTTQDMVDNNVWDLKQEHVGKARIMTWWSDKCKLNGFQDQWIFPCVCNV